jgi:predicted nucleic acid-binding protein
LSGPHRYYVDTNVIIGILELPQTLSAEQNAFVAGVEAGKVRALTSELTVAECLVKPFANADQAGIAAFLTFLDGRPNFPVLPATRDLWIAAAEVRAKVRCSLPDALHIATAVSAGCDVFLTDDKRLNTVAPLKFERWSTLTLPSF